MGIKVESKGSSYDATTKWLQKMASGKVFDILNSLAPLGTTALANATPTDTGDTQHMWDYVIKKEKGYYSIVWTNSHREYSSSTPIAILIQYGHGTRNGGYVQGIDYVNPAIKPVFEQILAKIVEEVNKTNG